MGISLEVGEGPIVRIESGIKFLLQGAQIPAFGMARRPGPAQQRLPASIRKNLLHPAVGVLDFQPETEARLAQGPSAIAAAMEQHGGSQDFLPGWQIAG